MKSVVLALALAAGANAECPNACSGSGTCGAYDMCTCHRGFQGADCSERTCQFGIAHVDSPKGDLDMSADALTTTTTIVGSTVYPQGTEEKFPAMMNSDGDELDETAHYYMECSNKGICDRKEGVCECFDGYEGSSCQRASCPEGCSGHGTCEHIETLAGDVPYALWDTGMTMGCKCDAGYSGADCASKDCKYGVDPAYIDDEATARVSQQSYTLSGSPTGVYPSDFISGTYALKFFDVFGEDYVTEPILVDTQSSKGDSCAHVVSALEGLPNTVIPPGSVACSLSQRTADEITNAPVSSGQTYSVTFTGNPGYLKPLFVDTYLDGARETVSPVTVGQATTVSTFAEGISGEFVDYFASKCEGVEVTIKGTAYTTGTANALTTAPVAAVEMTSAMYLDELTDPEAALLKKCLGDSDGNDSYGNNVEVYDWDYGSYVITDSDSGDGSDVIEAVSSHPHAIKLVNTAATDDYVGGLYYLTWYQSLTNTFQLVNGAVSDSSGTYNVYTTDGVVERVIVDVAAKGQLVKTSGEQPPVTAYFTQYSNVMYTSYDVACETAPGNVEPCLDKGDMLFIVDTSNLLISQNVSVDSNQVALPHSVSDSGDLYTISKIYKADPTSTTFSSTGHEDRFRIVLDKNIPFAGDTKADSTAVSNFGGRTAGVNVGIVGLFKFSPATTGNYEFVSQCSGRGSCVDGLCECFKGYTRDNCGVQSAYAV